MQGECCVPTGRRKVDVRRIIEIARQEGKVNQG
jgi:hypothetical protein